jgi:hypothetical protein
MGAVWELVSTYGTGNGSLTTLTHVWDPLSVQAIRANTDNPPAMIMADWAYFSAAGDVTIHSPRMHDDIQAVHSRVQATTADILNLECFQQVMYSQDLPIVSSTYAAAPGNTVAENYEYLIYYPNLGGGNQRLAPWAQIRPLIQSYLGVKVSPITGATAGQSGAAVLLNATEDYTKANSWYALYGYEVSVAATSIAIQGPDTSNYIVGGPATTGTINTRRWFYQLEQETGIPSIPIINSANKSSTNIYAVGTTASTTVPVTLHFAYLGPVASNPNLGQS